MVNITPATVISTTVTPGSLQTAVDAAEVDAVLAATRSLAEFGAGAFTCGGGQIGSAQTDHRQPDGSRSGIGFGTWSGSGDAFTAAALPRIRSTFGSGSLGRPAGGRLGAYQSSPVSTKQNNQMTRINPVTPGGLGPHPVREPVPV